MPTSHIPARVAAGAAEADATLASLAAAANQPDTSIDAAPAPAPAQDPAPAPPASPSVQPVPADDLRQRLAQLEQHLRTTQGRLEVVNEQNSRLQGRLEEALRAPPAPSPAPVPPPSLVTDKDREDYGDDLISLIGRVFDQKLGSSLGDMSSKLAMLEGRVSRLDSGVQSVQQTTEQQRAQQYHSALDQLCPNWEAINEEPALLDWLENLDTLSGKKYAELLADAHHRREAGRVAHIFNLYKSGTTSAPQPAGTQPQLDNSPGPTIDPMTLAAPDTAPASAAPAAPPAGKVWTQAEVDKLYDDKQKKRITIQEFQQRESDYLRALAEGRVAAQA